MAILSEVMRTYVNPCEPGWTPSEHVQWIERVARCLHELIPGSVHAPNLVHLHVGNLIVTIAPDSAYTVSMRLQTRERHFLTDGQVAALPIDWDENYLTVDCDDVLNVVTDIRRRLDPSSV